jgi:hypothetical protein
MDLITELGQYAGSPFTVAAGVETCRESTEMFPVELTAVTEYR